MSMFTLVAVTFVITSLGGGIGYLLWLKTRPKRIAWNARCYQIGEGVKPAVMDKHGVAISDLLLNDLKPYYKDILERVEKAHGVIVYRLQDLNMTTNAVNADMVDVWGKSKEVHVLIRGSTATVLKKGYDQKTGNVVFQPMPRERIELIKSEMLIKKDRLKEEKNILQAITPWIVVGISILGLVAIAYFVSEKSYKSSQEIKAGQVYAADKQVEAANIYREALIEMSRNQFYPEQPYGVSQLGQLGAQPPPIINETLPPPMIDG